VLLVIGNNGHLITPRDLFRQAAIINRPTDKYGEEAKLGLKKTAWPYEDLKKMLFERLNDKCRRPETLEKMFFFVPVVMIFRLSERPLLEGGRGLPLEFELIHTNTTPHI
jgi:hypothetical protein